MEEDYDDQDPPDDDNPPDMVEEALDTLVSKLDPFNPPDSRPRGRLVLRDLVELFRQKVDPSFPARTDPAFRDTVEKLLPASEKFDPVLFLRVVHQNTHLTDVTQGIQRLTDGVVDQTSQLRKLVNEDMDSFIGCRETVDKVRKVLGNIAELHSIETVRDEYANLLARADRVYTPLMAGQKEALRVQNLLILLRRFRFVFFLPRRMKEDIANSDLDRVVRGYKSTLWIKAHLKGPVIGRVVQQVEEIVAALRRSLLQQLGDNISLDSDEQRRILDYLKDLNLVWLAG
ncbi:putative exocyst complex subunit 2 [Paratrimastix pyriformis]|uniref:Exocyst complex component n=1 Tax=Paratrimastix pyriformis TaxID=342808 RepID=A0ABQ8UMZ1_9EUKA|nr:putative exocyst complex subunit 2 [Paratrimastix pyriformis]